MKENILFYINTRVNSRKDKIENELNEKRLIEFKNMIISIVVTIAGWTVSFLAPSIGCAIAIAATGILCIKHKNYNKLDIRINRIENEIKHLKKLSEDYDISLEEKTEKAVNLRTNLDQKRKEDEEKYSEAKVYTFISHCVTATGVIGALINPVYGLIAIPGLISNVLTSKYEVGKYRSLQKVKEKINSLNHELEIYRIIEGTAPKDNEIEVNGSMRIKKAEVISIEKNEQDYKNLDDLFNEVFYYEEQRKNKVNIKK